MSIHNSIVSGSATIVYLTFFFLCPHLAYTQWVKTHVSGTVESAKLSDLLIENANQVHPKLKGATITALKDGEVYFSVTSDVKGSFSLYLDGGAVYELILARKDYYPKKFIIDCSDAPKKNSNHSCQLGADITLFKAEKGLNDSLLGEAPYTSAKFYGGIIKFDENEGEASRLRYSGIYKAFRSKK